MLLTIDIGNTNITCGIYKNGTLINKYRFCSDIHADKQSYESLFRAEFKEIQISNCIMSSVVDELTPIIREAVEKLFLIKPFIINSNTDLGIKICSKNPEKIGTDRIINVFAAGKIHSKPAIVIDIGTATTFDIINKDGDFIGGIILSGPETQAKALALNTSKLPQIDIKKAEFLEKTINIETEKAMLTGIVKGHAYAIEGLIEDCIKELGSKPAIIATGGYAQLISKHLKKYKFDSISPNLTLDGLNMAFELIRKQTI